MDRILRKMQVGMKQLGYEGRTVPIVHLSEVQEAVGNLIRLGFVNERLHRRWHFYLDTNKSLPEARTVIIVAMPSPLTRVWFKYEGSTYPADIPPDHFGKETRESRAQEALNHVLTGVGYKIAKAHLALKTLAVRSGLAAYGRNNTAYVSGMGSLCMLAAFYTDWPGEEDNWQASKAMEACATCSLCRDNCPTGSIPADRFLIRAEKCWALCKRWNQTSLTGCGFSLAGKTPSPGVWSVNLPAR